MRRPRLSVVALASLLFAASAPAVELVSSERLVGIALLDATSQSSDSFGPFDESLADSLTIQEGFPFPIYSYSAQASQQSNVAVGGISASGEVRSDGFMQSAWCSACTPGSAASSLEVVFDVATPTPYALMGSLQSELTDPIGGASFAGELRVAVRLTPTAGGPAVASFELVPTSATPCCTSLPVAANGVLAPGRYRFEIHGNATYPIRPISSGLTRAAYDVALAFPEVPAVPDAALALLALALLAVAAWPGLVDDGRA